MEDNFDLTQWLGSLHLEGGCEDTENKLREQEFEQKEAIIMLDRQLLSFIGINNTHITPILDGIVALKRVKLNVSSWKNEDVVRWAGEISGVDNATTEKFIEGLKEKKITGMGLMQISQTDLIEVFNLKKLIATLKITEAIHTLKQSNISPQSSFSNNNKEQEHTLVSVGFMEPFDMHLNMQTINKLLESADTSKKSFAPVICFAGPTGAGKSRIVNSLLSFDDRTQQKGPVVANVGQTESTTGNVQLFTGEVEKKRVYLLDVEGHSGRAPQALKAEFDAFWQNILQRMRSGIKFVILGMTANATPEEIEVHKKKMLKMRTDYVSEAFSQLTYLVSNVMIFVDRQPLINTGYITRVAEYAKHCDKNVNQTGLPHLFLIQNFSTDNPTETTYDIEKTTNIFIQRMAETGDNLLKTFKTVNFVKLPDFNSYSALYDSQLKALKQKINDLISDQGHWMMDKNNLFSEWLWVKVFQEICNRIRKLEPGESINTSEVFFHVCEPEDEELKKIHSCFEFVYDTLRPHRIRMPFLHYENLEDYRINRKKFFVDCRQIMLQRFVDACSSSWKAIVGSESAVEVSDKILQKYVEKYLLYANARAPCDFKGDPGVCICEKQVHSQGHKLAYTVWGQAWRLLDQFVVNSKDLAAHDFVDPQSTSELVAVFKQEVLKLLKADPPTRHQLRLELLKSSMCGNPLSENTQIKMTRCLVCLDSPPDTPMSCGHSFCHQCIVMHINCNFTTCPLCQKESTPFFMKSLQKYCGPRILGLCGGGIVRGLVMITMLQNISNYVGLPIHKLFDMIGGTGTGAILALSLGAANPPLSLDDCKQFYTTLMTKVFKNTSPTLTYVASMLFGSPHSISDLYNALKEKFGSARLIDTNANPDSTKVVVVSDNEDGGAPYLFGNFHVPSGDVDFLGTLWEAATASAADPTYFPCFDYHGKELMDGGLTANNPTMIAINKARQLWDTRPSLVVTLGTGQDSLANWSTIANRQSADSAKIGGEVNHYCTNDKPAVPYSHFYILPADIAEVNSTSTSASFALICAADQYLKSDNGRAAFMQTTHHLIAQLMYVADPSADKPITTASATGENVIIIKTRVPLHFVDTGGGNFFWIREDQTKIMGTLVVLFKKTEKSFSAQIASFQSSDDNLWKITYITPPDVRSLTCSIQIQFADNTKSTFHIAGSPFVIEV